MVTIQDRIVEVILAAEDAIKKSGIPEAKQEWILNGIKEMGWQWQIQFAHRRAAGVLAGMARESYPAYLRGQFIRECVNLKQYEELRQKEERGAAFLQSQLTDAEYEMLVDMLMKQAIDGAAGIYLEDEDEITEEDLWENETPEDPEDEKDPEAPEIDSDEDPKEETGGAADGK